MQTAYEELHSPAHQKQPKTSRSNDKLKFHFVTMMKTFFHLPTKQAKCQFEIEETRRRIKILEKVYSSCILIGLFAFWPYTVGSFSVSIIRHCSSLELKFRSVQLVKVSYTAILHIEMIRIFFIHFLSFFSFSPQQFKSFIMHSICMLCAPSYAAFFFSFTQPFVFASSSRENYYECKM